MVLSEYDNQNSRQRFVLEITFIFRKVEGYTPSGLGSRSFTVDRLVGWLVGENLLFFEIKI